MKAILLTASCLLLSSIATFSATLNVPGTHATIQQGLNAATTGDVVLVAPGTYFENILWPTVDGIVLQSSGNASNTIIDGGGVDRVINLDYPLSGGVVYTNATVIDGFTIQNGYLNITRSHGAGIRGEECSAIFRNLIVKDNLATDATWAWGAGIFIERGPNVQVENCTFENNEANARTYSMGGALHFRDNSDATITNCTFIDNKGTRSLAGSARTYGGTIYSNAGCDLTITNITILNSNANTDNYIYGGGIYMDGGTSTLTNVDISTTTTTGNSGRVYGGGIYYAGGGVSTWSNITISGQDIDAESYIYGGALYLENSSPTINSSFFTNSDCNVVTSGRVYGGGVYVSGGSPNFSKVYMTCNASYSTSYMYGGGFYIGDSATVGLTNALIAHNVISNTGLFTSGAGIFVGGSTNPSTLNATNVTVTENYRDAGTTSGVGLYNFGSTINLTNCIFWNNYTGNEIDGISGFTNNITYSDIRGGHAGTGNINVDPLFVANGTDYHLQASSLCINSGTFTGAPSDDLDGNPRPAGGGHDMGSFDYQPYTNIDFCPIIPPLSIELLSLSGAHQNNINTLEWTATNNDEQAYFEVEKSSDEKVWQSIGTVYARSSNNKYEPFNYSFDDNNIHSETSYYRLKLMTSHSDHTYSNIVTISFDKALQLKAFPNPFSNKLNISSSSTGQLELFNSSGKFVSSVKLNEQTVIDLSGYPKGLYLIQLKEAGTNKIIARAKVVKQ